MSDWMVEPTETPYADPTQFRSHMSRFVTGVAVVSCREDSGCVHGMTVNSFTSISLDPPTVLISVKPGKMHGLLARNGYFGVSILTEVQHSHCGHFSGRPQQDLAPDFIVRHVHPTLANCLAWFECEIAQRVEVNDHTLFIARVMACGAMEGSPLVFYGSRLMPEAPKPAPQCACESKPAPNDDRVHLRQ